MTSFDTLDAWLGWLETLHTSEIELGLERIGRVARALQLERFMKMRDSAHPKIVTVAGTNGKGSFVAATEQLLLASGVSVGAYTSPHLHRYNERIRINGVAVSDERIVAAFEDVEQARGDVSLTYFEFGTLAAFVIFLQSDLQYWVLEVGLGGRLDAVNLLHPDIAVITTIALDHQAWLGSTREKIAVEKAGIIRENIPVVIADIDPPKSLNNAVSENAFYIGKSFGVVQLEKSLKFFWGDGSLEAVECRLPLPSVAAALQVCSLLNSVPARSKAVKTLEALRLAGRYQKIHLQNGTMLILDVAHNPSATGLLAESLMQEEREGHIDAVVAMMADKDIDQALQPLLPHIKNWNLLLLNENNRAAQPEVLVNALKKQGVSEHRIRVITDLQDMVEFSGELSANAGMGKPKHLVVFGSFYTVEHVLSNINQG